MFFSVVPFHIQLLIFPMASLPVVAICGARGRAGETITVAFLSDRYRRNFKEIILLSRSESSTQLDKWAEQGAVIRPCSQNNITEALQGVNIIVNA